MVRFKQVDVFTARPLLGNPLAVVVEGEGLTDGEMQRLASWTNLSETVFLLPPTTAQASYRTRIFTPRAELPFAGHPTIGSAHAAIEAGLVKPDARLVQECGAALLPLRVEEGSEGRWIFVRAPEAKLDSGLDLPSLEGALGSPLSARAAPLRVEVGPVWIVALIDHPEDLAALKPDMPALTSACKSFGATGVTVFALQDGECAVKVRSFAPGDGIPEDPVCGSGNVSVAAFLRETGLLKETGVTYMASQGRELGRNGRVHLRVSEEGIEFGGQAVTVVEGEIRL
jgi:PhzF family phenazine biosynthesis protein